MVALAMREAAVVLPTPHVWQQKVLDSKAKRKIIKAGRRGGKTVTAAEIAVLAFVAGLRVLYAAPTGEQTDRFWFEVKAALRDAVAASQGGLRINEAERFLERVGTENRIKAKTAWNADSLRGDYADVLILDEWQIMAEDAWEDVGAPMLLDNGGTAVFIYTPPSLRSSGINRARDPRHASKMFEMACSDKTGRWEAFHWTSMDNPVLDAQALQDIVGDMSIDSYRKEILAEDADIEQSWLVYGKFDHRACRLPRFPIPQEWPIYVGHDFGQANPAALFLAQNPGTGEFTAWAEYTPGPGYSTAQHVEAFKTITKGRPVIRRVGGNQTTEDEIRQGYTAHGWPILAPKWGKVNVQLDRTLGLVQLNKIFVFSDMHGLLEELTNCLWVIDSDNRPTNKIDNEARYHLLACLRYIASDFSPETVMQKTKVRVIRC